MGLRGLRSHQLLRAPYHPPAREGTYCRSMPCILYRKRHDNNKGGIVIDIVLGDGADIDESGRDRLILRTFIDPEDAKAHE